MTPLRSGSLGPIPHGVSDAKHLMKGFAAKAAAHNNEIYRRFYAHLEEKDAEIIQLQGQLRSQAARLTEQEIDLSASQDEVSQLRQDMSLLEDQVQQMERNLDDCSAEARTLEAKLHNSKYLLTVRWKAAEHDLTEMRNDISAHEWAINERVARFETDRARLESVAKESERRVEDRKHPHRVLGH